MKAKPRGRRTEDGGPGPAHVTVCDRLPAGERFFTKPEMAKLLKVSIRTVSEMMTRGELAYLKIGGRLVRFRLADAERRLNETVLVCKGATEVNHETHETHEESLTTEQAKTGKNFNQGELR